jgi:hypothetical protein
VRIAVYLPLVLPVLAAVSARWLARRLEPRTATWLLTASALAFATASMAALAILAATALGQLPPLAVVGHWSARVVSRDDPVSVAVALPACLLFAVAAGATARASVRRIRAIADAARESHRLRRTGRLAVLDDPAPDAYALPGLPGRIVVTAGMLDALDDRERKVLLAHERTHLTRAHHLFVTVAELTAAANPLLRPVASAVRYSVERWADERAAKVIGDRRLVARTVGKAALLSEGYHEKPSVALCAAQGNLRRAGPVPRRVAALLAAPPSPRPLLLAAALGVLALAAASALEAARDLHALLQLAGGP